MKKSLKAGLLSLIPNRELQDADDILDELEGEGIEEIEEAVAVREVEVKKVEEKPVKKQKLNVVMEEVEEETPSEEVEEEPIVEEEIVVDDTVDEIEDSVEGLPDQDEPAMPAPIKPLVTPLTIEIDDEELELKKEVKLAEVAKSKKAAEKVIREAEATVENVKAPKVDVRELEEYTPDPDKKWDVHEDSVNHVVINQISINPNQPRRKFQEADMDELRNSLDKHGILQPLVVRRMDNGKYELIAGERRLRAATSLGWEKVPCVVRKGAGSGATRIEMALIENIQREDLNPIEVAMAYKQLNEEYGMTHDEIGERVGRSRVNVTNTIRILQLPPEIQKGLIDDKITPGHARAILMIPDEQKQIRFYRHLLEEGLTVRKAETRARRIQRAMEVDDPMRIKRQGRSQYEMKYGGMLEDRFGYDAKVKFKEELNKFEVMFRCYSKDQIKELMGRLLGDVPLESKEDDQDIVGEK